MSKEETVGGKSSKGKSSTGALKSKTQAQAASTHVKHTKRGYIYTIPTKLGTATRSSENKYEYVAASVSKSLPGQRTQFTFHKSLSGAQRGYGRAWDVKDIVKIIF